MRDLLLRLLMRDGPQPASALAAGLGCSQPTFSRLVRSMGDDVVAGGRSRQTRYAARRRVLGVAAEEPVFVVGRDGVERLLGTLQAVHPGFMWVASSSPSSSSSSSSLSSSQATVLWTADLPWFLADLRPAGFLGRQVPGRHPELELPDDVRLWSADHVLRFITRYGHDLVGNLIVGEGSRRRLREVHPDVHTEADYPGLAVKALAAGTPGSSAGGEQPKFLTRRRHGERVDDVLVKFSPPQDTVVGRRVAGLLVCEHLALRALQATGVPVAESRVVVVGDRTFLEVVRFDRTAAGRRGLVSLQTLDDAFVGSERHRWVTTTRALLQQRRIRPADHRLARIAAAFGAGIDNSDMHLGNLSLFVDDDLAIGGLAPVYDMLPMRHAPVAGQLVERDTAPFHLDAVDDDIKDVVLPAVRRFWQDVATDDRVDDGLRAIAERHLASSRDRDPPAPRAGVAGSADDDDAAPRRSP